jgi:3,4-dihydroxy 2-butanone 4-phosphate synthase / GTP cyclohydrolase II
MSHPAPLAPLMLQSRVEGVIEAFRQGQLIIVTDDDDRENEGDLFVAASLCTPEQMAFIVRHTSGIVCTPMSASEARRLHLAPMVASNDAPLGTAFTVSVDVKRDLTTGISAQERTNTVRALANHNAMPQDFVRPGHIFPLIAREGGVLIRSGHTEACVDLCRLADLPPVGVISELVNDDGTVMRGPDISTFASKHNIKTLSVADLIAYRQSKEKLVERVSSFQVATSIGTMQGYAYTTGLDRLQHLALVHGSLVSNQPTLVRLHRGDPLTDVFGGGKSIEAALQRFKQEGAGVLVYLRDGAVGVTTQTVAEEGEDHETANKRQQFWHEVGLGAQILRDLGLSQIRLISSRPRKYVALSGFGLTIVKDETL